MPTPWRRSPPASPRTPRVSSCWSGWWRPPWSLPSEVSSSDQTRRQAAATCLLFLYQTSAATPVGRVSHGGEAADIEWKKLGKIQWGNKLNKSNKSRKWWDECSGQQFQPMSKDFMNLPAGIRKVWSSKWQLSLCFLKYLLFAMGRKSEMMDLIGTRFPCFVSPLIFFMHAVQFSCAKSHLNTSLVVEEN